VIIIKTLIFVFWKNGIVLLYWCLALNSVQFFANGLEIFFVENIDADVNCPITWVFPHIRSFILFFHERKSLFHNMLKLVSFCLLYWHQRGFLIHDFNFFIDLRLKFLKNLKYIISSSVLLLHTLFSRPKIFSTFRR
jgi:hypothetical protein